MGNARTIFLRCFGGALVVLLQGVASEATGQEAGEPQAAAHDPPGRVGRIGFVEGTVSFKPAGAADWTAAVVNQPVTRGDSLWVGDSGRTEVQVGTAVVRLGPQSSLYVPNLDDSTLQLSLTQGTMAVHVREVLDGDLLETDLPNAAVTLQAAGTYRFDVDDQGAASALTLRDGARAEIMSGGKAATAQSDHVEEIRGVDGADLQEKGVDPVDGFDDWCASRDSLSANSTALQYVSPNTVGYEDLDAHGSWMSTPDYGTVWAPTSYPANWAPYSFGHWVYIEPWGWTWVDDAAWGFAPFHYGRWAYWGSRWCWAPGPIVRRPVYGPALVGWGHAGGYGTGNVTWFPLGWHEPYVPGYHTSYNYVRQINAPHVHVTGVANLAGNTTFVNRGVPGAMTSVNQSVMRGGEAVGGAHQSVSTSAAMHGGVTFGGPGVEPTQQSRVGMPARGPVAHPPAQVANRPTVYRAAPPGHVGPSTYAQPPARAASSIAVAPVRRFEPDITRVQQPNREPQITRVQQPGHDVYNRQQSYAPSRYEPNFHSYVRPAPAASFSQPRFAPSPHYSRPAGPSFAGGGHFGGGGGHGHR